MSFIEEISKIHKSGSFRTIVLNGNVYDLFDRNENDYCPLIPYLQNRLTDSIIITYELNGPIRISDKKTLKGNWAEWRLNNFINVNSKTNSVSIDKFSQEFEDNLNDSIGNPTCALEFLRQISLMSRNCSNIKPIVFLIEAADMILPSGNGDIASLNDKQLHRISIIHDWVLEPSFINGFSTLILISESKSLIHPKIAKLPVITSIEIPVPSMEDRKKMITFGDITNSQELAELSASLSLYSIYQMLKGKNLTKENILKEVESNIKNQLGDDVIEFKRPKHTLNDCIGNNKLKKFIKDYLIPRFQSKNPISGAAVAGPIGSGKTFIFEAMAGELGIPVIVLKNIRSQWYGQTDVIFERLKRSLTSLDKVLIFVDEADTQFGSVGNDAHETERRLTGKIQAMMSDTSLKGKVFWLLMTARIHLLSPDIRRPGRAGDLIIPVFDPIDSDLKDFVSWMLKNIVVENIKIDEDFICEIKDYLFSNGKNSAAFISTLKENLEFIGSFKSLDALKKEIDELQESNIQDTRKFQTYQAILNTTRSSLLPNNVDKNFINKELSNLIAKGIS